MDVILANLLLKVASESLHAREEMHRVERHIDSLKWDCSNTTAQFDGRCQSFRVPYGAVIFPRSVEDVSEDSMASRISFCPLLTVLESWFRTSPRTWRFFN
jgi:hypothetical protein